MLKLIFTSVFAIIIFTVGYGQGRIIKVSSTSQLETAVKDILPGDTIIVKDGSYNFGGNISVSKSGDDENKVTIRAESIGGVILIGESYFDLKQVSFIIIEGFVFKSTDVTAIKTEGCDNIRITRNTFQLNETASLKWIVIGGVWNDANIISQHNRIDHNLFEGKNQPGNCITIDGTSDPTYQSSRYDIIDHNYFRNVGPRIDNGMETIRLGWSELSMSSGFTTVEYNLFEDCDGDPEIISVKSSDDTVRYNTFRSSQGTLCLRHGNRTSANSNFFLGENKPGAGGIRIYGDDHKVYNNYFEGLTGTIWDAPITLTNGDYDSGTNYSKHFRINRAKIVFNTLVNNKHGIEIGYTNNGNYSKPPRDVIIANNIITASENELVRVITSPVNINWSTNIFYPSDSASTGIQFTETQAKIINPNLIFEDSLWLLSNNSPAIDSASNDFDFVIEDLEGQARDDHPDIGADEYSMEMKKNKPLTSCDVGPYSDFAPVTSINENYEIMPGEFKLYQNYPNPFNPTTRIRYCIPSVGRKYALSVKLKVYDILGNEVATLVNEEKFPGAYEVDFSSHSNEGRNLSSGIYFYRLFIYSDKSNQNGSQTNKMILLR